MLHTLDVLPTFVLEPAVHPDARGSFHEWFKASEFESFTGYPFDVQQANLSRSHAGVVRGLHFATVPPGQEKFVTCVSGRIVDVIVDIRRGSDTLGKWEAVELSAENTRCLFVPNGFAHGFVAHEDSAVVYLTSAEYNPSVEHGINPLDPELAIPWADSSLELILSDKDRGARSLCEMTDTLPTLEACEAYANSLKDAWVEANAAFQEDLEA